MTNNLPCKNSKRQSINMWTAVLHHDSFGVTGAKQNLFFNFPTVARWIVSKTYIIFTFN